MSLAASNFAKFLTQKMTEQTINNATEKTTVMDEASTNSLQSKQIGHSPECSATFPRMFGDIPRNVWRHCLECLATFPGMLATFPGMFDDIPRNV